MTDDRYRETRDEARRYLAAVLDDLDTPGEMPRDGSYTYDTRRGYVRGFMLAGGGPTVYAWFGHDYERRLIFSTLEHSTDDGRSVFVEIPDHRAAELFTALSADARARESR